MRNTAVDYFDINDRRSTSLRSSVMEQTNLTTNCWITQKPNQSGWNLSKTKRAIDILLSLMLLLILSPIMLLVAFSVGFTSAGPIFFIQERTGYLGRRFKMVKFRTMVANAELLKADLQALNAHKDSPDFKVKNDSRVTKVGYYLRKYSLDELPQLFNVLKGDMSLVGPRPTSFGIEKYSTHHLGRLSSKPGLTGIWQISGRSDIEFCKRVDLDISYYKNQGPIQDLKIMIKTPLVVMKGDGAY